MDLDLEPRTGASKDTLHLELVGLIGNAVAGPIQMADIGRLVAWRLLQGVAKQMRREGFTSTQPRPAALSIRNQPPLTPIT